MTTETDPESVHMTWQSRGLTCSSYFYGQVDESLK